MPRNCYVLKAGAFIAAAFNILVGGLSLGGAIYKVVVNKNGRTELLIVMFLMSVLLLHNGMLLVVSIVMVNKEYAILYLVLNSLNWLVGTLVILKEISTKMTVFSYVGLGILLVGAWCLEVLVYFFYKRMCDRNLQVVEV